MKQSNYMGAICIGTEVKFGNMFGIVDEVHEELNRYGFVTSDDKSWTSCLVHPDDVVVLTNQSDIDVARANAIRYFDLEIHSLTNRIAMQYEMDQEPFWQKRLADMLQFCQEWHDELTCNSDVICS